MESERFDCLARALGDHATRRGMLAVLASVTGLGAGESLASHHRRHRRGQPAQTEGCRTLNQSCTPKSPKGPGKWRKCCQGLVCLDKRCQALPCPSFSRCGGVCVDLQTDPKNCGACNRACLQGERCLGGACQPPAQCGGLFAACNDQQLCCPSVGDTNPQTGFACDLIQSQKGPRTCATPGGGGVPVCCRHSGAICGDDCECCQDLRCRNGVCGPCHSLGEACTDGGGCCNGAGLCDGSICCLADGANCPCPDPTRPANCQGCCSGLCGADGRCGSGSPSPCTPYGQPCTAAADCCLLQDGSRIPCNGGLCRFN